MNPTKKNTKPVRDARRAADIKSFSQAAAKPEQMLAEHGIGEDEIVREFQRVRREKRSRTPHKGK